MHARAGRDASLTRAKGSAAIEFIALAPFILLTMALVWDLRDYVAHRTELARQVYVVAELMANQLDTGPDVTNGPVGEVVRRAMEQLSRAGAGTMAVAVVARGSIPVGSSGSCNLDKDTCLPMVRVNWPPADAPGAGTWANASGSKPDGGHCATFDTQFPAAGDHFPATQPVLPNEVPPNETPPPQEEWLSRNMSPEEWWVLIDSCLHADAGLFGGLALGGLRFFDTSQSAFVLRKRAAWGSVHVLSDCNWC